MKAHDLLQKIAERQVRVHGHHPGSGESAYDLGLGIVDDAWDVIRPCGGSVIGFHACGHTWPGVDSWHEREGCFYGHFTAGMHGNEQGLVVIEVIG